MGIFEKLKAIDPVTDLAFLNYLQYEYSLTFIQPGLCICHYDLRGDDEWLEHSCNAACGTYENFEWKGSMSSDASQLKFNLKDLYGWTYQDNDDVVSSDGGKTFKGNCIYANVTVPVQGARTINEFMFDLYQKLAFLTLIQCHWDQSGSHF